MGTTTDPMPQRPRKMSAPSPTRLSKQEALRLATIFKRGVMIAATLGFGAFIGLVSRHNGTTTTSQPPSAAPSAQTTAPAQSTAQSTSAANNYFNSQGQGNYGFGVGNNQPPVSGSSSS